ncbi:MAG: hypothetical protein WBV25_07435 [Methylocella sp.]
MDRREFLAAAGTVAAAATASQAFAQTGEEPMHPPKYKALYAMKDTSMAGCADAAYQVVVACGAQQALAAVNSPHVGAVAKGVEQICKACQTECAKAA